jgi:hypothetical protein
MDLTKGIKEGMTGHAFTGDFEEIPLASRHLLRHSRARKPDFLTQGDKNGLHYAHVLPAPQLTWFRSVSF